MNKKVCDNCKYMEFPRVCHLHPPQRLYVPETDSRNGHSISAFPCVEKYDWCGDFKAKRKRIVFIRHSDGTQEVDPSFK